MSPTLVFLVILLYFALLVTISFITARKTDTQGFFIANKQSPWYVVAFGMIGASLSGVTFISVPGAVEDLKFSYFQVVMGYTLGYLVIGTVLLPLYYRLNLVSIYSYLETRFGFWSYKTGAFFFLLSRIVGASFRLFLAAGVLQLGLFDKWGIPFEVTAFLSILLIWIYTFRGGIKTIVWTDTLQTAFMLIAALTSLFLIKNELNLAWGELTQTIHQSPHFQIFFWEGNHPHFFVKDFLSGAFIAIVMTGLDQDMMQKNLSCKNIGEAQKNIFWFTIVLVIVNFLFLSLGAMLYAYADAQTIALPMSAEGKVLTDKVYPVLAFEHFGLVAGITFLLGIVAATYSSADSALTSLTTSFSVDFLDITQKEEAERQRTVRWVHVGFSILLALVIILFKSLNDDSVISNLFKAAGYTYGPLLGMYAYGLFTKRSTLDQFVPIICVISPIFCYILNLNSEAWLGGYKFGFEILIVNGALTFLGLWLLSFFGGKKYSN